jgi:hypothetical protein
VQPPTPHPPHLSLQLAGAVRCAPPIIAPPDQPHARLSPEDGIWLLAYFRANRCLLSLAQVLEQPIDVIFNWFDQPCIQRATANHDAGLIAAHKTAAMNILRRALDETRDPVERRRTACALLNSTRPRRLLDRVGAPPPRETESAAPGQNPFESPARAAEAASTTAPRDPHHDAAQQPSLASPPPGAPAPCPTSAHHAVPGPSPANCASAPATTQLPRPSPDLSPMQVVELTRAALANPDQPFPGAGPLTLRNFATRRFPIDPGDHQHFQGDVEAVYDDIFITDTFTITTRATTTTTQPTSAPQSTKPTTPTTPDEPETAILLLTCTYPRGRASELEFHLSRPRDGPHPACWLIDNIIMLKVRAPLPP